VHDGPIQEITAATLALQMMGRQANSDLPLDEIQQRLNAAARSLRGLVDSDSPFLRPQSRLPETIQQQTAWLLSSPVTLDVQPSSAAVGSAAVGSAAVGSAAVGSAAVGSAAVGSAAVDTEAPMIADIVELALFVMTGDDPPGRAHVCIQAGEHVVQIRLTLTRPVPDGQGAGDPAAVRAPLAELASALGGTSSAEFGPGCTKAWIRLPRQPAVDNQRHLGLRSDGPGSRTSWSGARPARSCRRVVRRG
jgi:hypothetical protein